ncbi:MAG: TIM barrel protein [Clostridiales bacterium]|nr:TIM barrel protein [Clostridiales bacterium]
MKIAFSTLACPDWSFTDVLSAAKDFGFDGVEIRGLGKDISIAKSPSFSDEQLPETLRKLSSMRVSIQCFSSARALKHAASAQENIKEISDYIDLAAKTGAPYVRVLADEKMFDEGDVDDNVVLDQLKRLAALALKQDITLLVETNGVYADTKRLRALLDTCASDAVAALWVT